MTEFKNMSQLMTVEFSTKHLDSVELRHLACGLDLAKESESNKKFSKMRK